MEYKYIVILFSIAFLGFLFFKEMKRPNRSNLYLRLTASLIMVICFVLLIVPISYRVKQSEAVNEVILLTDGYHIDSVSKLKGKKYIVSENRVTKGITAIPDLGYFLTTNPQLNKFKIYGYGLEAHELKLFANKAVDFHPANDLVGVVNCSWNKTLTNSTPLFLQGIYQNSNDEAVKLVLKGFGKHLDSIIVEGKSTHAFSFRNQPKQIGKAIYQLISLQGKDTIAIEPVPFEVTEAPKVRVLILTSSPDFEYKFLKNWLYESRYPLAIRTQISKDKYGVDFLNLDRFNINQLTKKMLKNFDVLITDEDELFSISAGDRTVINDAINNGLGLFLKLLPTKESKLTTQKNQQYDILESKEKTLSLQLVEQGFKFSQLPVVSSTALITTGESQPIITDLKGRAFVKSTIKLEGKMVVSLVPSTYNWMLAGKKQDYQMFWSSMLTNSARKRNKATTIAILPKFPMEKRKITFVVEQQTSGIPKIRFQNHVLSPRQNIELPFKWDAEGWSLKQGWNAVLADELQQDFFVYKHTDWQAYQNYNKMTETAEFTRNDLVKSSTVNENEIIVYKDVSLWWFFVGFLLAIGFLWYESRVLSGQ